MALKPLAELSDFELVDSDQDCRGSPALDADGQSIGTVREMLVDTEAEHVTTLVLDSGVHVPARAVSFHDHSVIADETRGGSGESDPALQDRVVVPVIEETIRVGKRVERGCVRVSAHLEERPVQESVTLHSERVEVERRPVDRPVGAAGVGAFEERTIEVHAHAEEPVVEKQARVVEEVVVTRNVTEHVETVRDTVRRTEVDIERIDLERGDTRRTAR